MRHRTVIHSLRINSGGLNKSSFCTPHATHLNPYPHTVIGVTCCNGQTSYLSSLLSDLNICSLEGNTQQFLLKHDRTDQNSMEVAIHVKYSAIRYLEFMCICCHLAEEYPTSTKISIHAHLRNLLLFSLKYNSRSTPLQHIPTA